MFQFTEKDVPLLREYRRNFQLTSELLHCASGRNFRSVQRRILALRYLGYLSWLPLPDIRNGHMVSFPTLKGWLFLNSIQAVDPPEGLHPSTLPAREDKIRVDTKSNKNFAHDLRIAKFYLDLRDRLPEGWRIKTWERLPAFISFKTPEGYLAPDAFLRYETPEVEDGCIFLEVENSNPNVRDNRQSILAKCDQYEAYFKSGEFERRWGAPNFRVIFLMRTKERVINQCLLMQDKGYSSLRWYLTDYESAENPATKIFRTPKDFDRGEVYSLAD